MLVVLVSRVCRVILVGCLVLVVVLRTYTYPPDSPNGCETELVENASSTKPDMVHTWPCPPNLDILSFFPSLVFSPCAMFPHAARGGRADDARLAK